MPSKGKQCYSCAYREKVQGSYHSRCFFNWRGGSYPVGNPHGIKNGWYLFPLNFDPVWMEGTCPNQADNRDPTNTIIDSPEQILASLMGRRTFR